MNKPAMPISASLFAFSLVSVLLSAPAHASEPEEAADRSHDIGLGLAVVSVQKGYADIDDDVRFLPLVHYENRWIRFDGGDLDLKLPSLGPVEFSLAARYRIDGYEADDAPILAGMETREESVWGGVAASWQNDIVDLSAEWLMDPMSNSEGQQARITASHSFDVGSLQVTPRIAAHWMDDDYVNYYYGVTQGEALANRPFYEGTSTTNFEAGVRTGYAFGERQRVFLDVAGEIFGAEIEDSPLIDRSSRVRVSLGYMYMF